MKLPSHVAQSQRGDPNKMDHLFEMQSHQSHWFGFNSPRKRVQLNSSTLFIGLPFQTTYRIWIMLIISENLCWMDSRTAPTVWTDDKWPQSTRRSIMENWLTQCDSEGRALTFELRSPFATSIEYRYDCNNCNNDYSIKMHRDRWAWITGKSSPRRGRRRRSRQPSRRRGP